MSADFLHPLVRDVFSAHFPGIRTTALGPDGEEVEVTGPESCHCGGTGRVCDHPCNRCTKEPTMIEDTKATTEERIAALRARIEGAETREKAAFIETHRARAELAAAEGRDWDRQYHEALADAQAHIPGGHERFWRLCNTRDAQRIIAGEATLTDFAPHERTGIAAEVERLRAESGESDAGKGA